MHQLESFPLCDFLAMQFLVIGMYVILCISYCIKLNLFLLYCVLNIVFRYEYIYD